MADMQSDDPCGSFGPDQKWAVVWFFSVIIGGAIFTSQLARIDEWMYRSNGEVRVFNARLIDFDVARENRRAATGIASERNDPRADGSFGRARASLSE